MKSQNEIREEITQQIVDALEDGTLPWRRNWICDANSGIPASLSTSVPYRGINQILLLLAGMKRDFQSRWWGTYNQIQTLGGQVRKGEKGTNVVLYKAVRKKKSERTGEEKDDVFFMMRTFRVFNAEQADGLERFQIGHSKAEWSDIERFEHADRVIEATGAEIRHRGNQPCYDTREDVIRLPFPHQFASSEAYYATAFHELIHWTEHPTRLDWDRKNEGYAMGELIAELGACFVLGQLGIANPGLGNHAAYLQSWLSEMKKNPRFIFQASSQASRAAEYILNFCPMEQERVEETAATA
ncbi:ArdC family protein [Candidatus Laterigemmans baculatus]|uniref:ArdC family protein n=1 Tax=Candidatus Laterigemmans baculatus TaxID=2770505 RepID=UPI0013DBCA90|nr:zincin-like metallopeptidase domain-containing protein [Candidatus Laterigemmans baculatus]